MTAAAVVPNACSSKNVEVFNVVIELEWAIIVLCKSNYLKIAQTDLNWDC